MPDKKAVAVFREKGIHLSTNTKIVRNHRIHFVQTGRDTLPSLVFLHGTTSRKEEGGILGGLGNMLDGDGW